MKAAETPTPAAAVQRKASATSFFGHSAEQENPFFAAKCVGNADSFFNPPQPSKGSKSLEGSPSRPTIQAKLTVGAPNDKYEQEADSMADKVVQRMGQSETLQRQTAPSVSTATNTVSTVEEDKLQKKEEEKLPEAMPELQRSPVSKVGEEEGLQMKEEEEKEEKGTVQRKENGESEASTSIESRLSASKGGGNPLPNETRNQMESAMGADFSGVRVHTGSEAVGMSQDLNAHAFTHGADVYFNSGKYNPSNTEGSRLLAHELTHTVQQGENLVQPSLQLYRQRIIRSAPADAMNISAFIDLVALEEAKYTPEEQVNTPLMITRLRKIFYNSPGWNERLIPGTDATPSPYGEPRIQTRRTVAVDFPYTPFDLDFTDTEYYPVDAQGQSPAIYNNQSVRLETGNHTGVYIDMGHVFAGLDAFNHRQQVGIANITIDNVDGVTWVGDLASVLAELQFQFINNDLEPLGQRTIQSTVDEFASPEDMLGNIDAYAVHSFIGTSSLQKVSDILRAFYLNDLGNQQSHRYHIFANSIGLSGWNGTNWTNTEERIAHHAEQVNNAAALYIGAGTSRLEASSYPFALGLSSNLGSISIVRNFFRSLQSAMQTETDVP